VSNRRAANVMSGHRNTFGKVIPARLSGIITSRITPALGNFGTASALSTQPSAASQGVSVWNHLVDDEQIRPTVRKS
jgi:hypothetical protein